MLRFFLKRTFAAAKEAAPLPKIVNVEKPAPVQQKLTPIDLKVGDVLGGLNIMVGGSDPVIKEDSEYPPWIFKVLEEQKPKVLDDYEITTRKQLKRANVAKMRKNNEESAAKTASQ